MPRKAGSLLRCKCFICGTQEMSRGGGKYFRCVECKEKGLQRSNRYRDSDLIGRDQAMGFIQVAIRSGRLPHPSTLECADCRAPATEYEHRDYSKPLAVEPICRSCNLKRGPAIPVRGAIETLVERGRVPYARRLHASMLFRLMGIPTVVLDAMPKRLALEHWQTLVPHVAQREAQIQAGV